MKAASVLIVEDEGIVAEDIQQTLRSFGYDAYAIASSAEEAIHQASLRCPDLVLMDIRIHGKRDGIETAAILRRDFGVPVVFLTAHADEATIQRAQKTEPFGYLMKPVRAAELRSVIEIGIYRNEMERRLRERERWFSTTLQSIADAVVTVDLAGNVTFMNPEAEQLTGLAAANVIGRPSREVLRLLDDAREAVSSPLERAIHEGRAIALPEASLVNATSGRMRTVSDSAAPVIADGRVLGAVMVFRDITESKLIQKQLELADRLASLGTMAAGVAHELNNPLAVVMANTGHVTTELAALADELAGDDRLGRLRARFEDLAQALEDTTAAGTRIGRIVSELRAFSRPAPTTSGRADVVSALDWAIRTTVQELRLRARVTTTLAPVPHVLGDEMRLGQVFVNLLVNAAQAIEPGSVETNEVRVTTSADSAGRVIVEISDTGAGMTEEVRRRIFEPFFTTKAVGVGTGLGLSICHGIVRSMGGELAADSEPGRGTTMRVVLHAAPAIAEASAPTRVAPVGTKRGTILAVDDEPLVLRALQRMLRDHELVTVESARDALVLIDRGAKFDLIIADLMMPSMSGIDLFEEILSRSPELANRMVFITGGALTVATEDFLRSTKNEWLEKPFTVAAVRALVDRHLALIR